MFPTFSHITPDSIRRDPAVIKSKDKQSAGKRRYHNKSRKGCDTCRRRHLKCDEERPECGQCLYGKRSCVYPSPLTDMDINETNTRSNQSLKPLRQFMSQLLGESFPSLGVKIVNPTDLIDHFFQTTEPLWMGSAQCQALLQEHCPRLAVGAPFLLYAMLAISSHHIASFRHEQQLHERTGTLYYSLALQAYRKALNDESVDGDAIFACCMILGLLTFKYLSDDDTESDAPKRRKNPVLDTAGIRFIGGPRVLANIYVPQSVQSQSVWRPFLKFHSEKFVASDQVFAGSPMAFQALSDLEAICHSGQVETPYDKSLISLWRLMECYIFDKARMVENSFCFAIDLDRHFLQLIEESDPRALLVLCYWYALATHIDQWWACQTSRIACLRLLNYLQNTNDSAIQSLLEYPAKLLSEK